MKLHLKQLVADAIASLQQQNTLPEDLQVNIQIESTRDKSHGDFASNIAMMLAKPAKQNPRNLAQQIIDALPASNQVEKVEIAGPGFINFFVTSDAFHDVVRTVLQHGDRYGLSNLGQNKPVQVEFVSANPTGPLHVGHGRGAAYGAAVADLLAAVGYKVHREYYVNDAGRQMDILATSVYLRYLYFADVEIPFPSNAYQGDYVQDFAATLHRTYGNDLRHPAETVMKDIPPDETQGGDKEKHIDALINRTKELLGEGKYREIFDLGLNEVLDNIRQDLKELGIEYDEWFFERSLTETGAVDNAIARLKESDHIYEKNGALWFRSTDYGDEKDRVVVRDNGQKTYFASDIAYHANKLERGYERVIDIWGADHHGYIPRVKAALKALGDDDSKLDVLLVQFASLYRNGEKVQMSTRSGEYVTLHELRHEVGNDATRFFYVMRKCEQHMDFDLDLAKSQSNDNPVYYIQYAHARVCSVLQQMKEKGMTRDEQRGNDNLNVLCEEHEQGLMVKISRYPQVLEAAAINHEPHQLAHYLRELAGELHTYYNAHQFLVDDEKLRDARLSLIIATRQVLHNGLKLLGVSAPESM